MAQLVIAAAGALAGGALFGTAPLFLGVTGQGLGWFAGSVLGSALAPRNRQSGPRLDELRVTGTEYGGGIAWVAGAPRVAGDLIWASDRRKIATTEEVGKGGGSEYTTFSYEIDAMYLLADQPGAIVTRCWDNGKLIWTNLASADDGSRLASEQTTKWRRITVYDGADTQMPDPTYEAAVTNAPAYTRRLCVFIEGLQLGNSGALPNLTWEVASVGDSSPNFVRRYEVADTGRQFADQYSDALGRPALLSIAPTVRVATLTDAGTEVYVFNLQGDADGTSSRTTAENYPSVYYFPGTYDGSSAPVGIMDGLPVRVANHFYALGGAYRHIRAGAKTGAAWDVGILPDLALCLPSGRYLGDTIPCSDGVHLLVFTAPTNAYFGSAVLNRWHIIRRNGLLGELVSEGDIDPPRAWMAYGSSGVNFSAAMMEDDLQHVWFAYGAGEGTLTMLKIEPDGVMRDRSSLRFALLSHGFTFPAIWAEGSFCVVVSRQSYQAFRRAGDVIDQVPLQDVVESLCDRATMPAGTYDASALAAITQPVRALAVTGGSARQALEILQASHGFDAHCTDKLYFVPRGGASVVTIDADDLAAGEGDASGEPFALTVNADLEMPSRIAVVFKNMSADQINGTEHSERGPTGQDSIQTIQLAIGMTPSEAKGVADAMVRDAYAARMTSQLSLPLKYTRLTPTDVIQVPDSDGTLYRMRITRRSDAGGIIALDIVGDDADVRPQAMATSAGYLSQTTVRGVVDSVLIAMDIPPLRDADNRAGYYVAARGASSPWSGCGLYSSPNGVSYSLAAQVAEPATIGSCSTTLGPWAGGSVMDEMNGVTVNMGIGELASVTRSELLEGESTNALLIGDEVVRFASAALQSSSPNIYRVTRLLRGQRGTEWASGSHVADERAVLLSTRGLRRIAQQAGDVLKPFFLKAVSPGQLLGDVESQQFTNTGRSQRPLAPVDVRVERTATDDLRITWKRRTRLSTKFCGTQGAVVPLDEVAEEYAVSIISGGLTARRLTVASAEAIYTRAQAQADYGDVPSQLILRIEQMSAAVGAGYAADATVSVPASIAAPPASPGAPLPGPPPPPSVNAKDSNIVARTAAGGVLVMRIESGDPVYYRDSGASLVPIGFSSTAFMPKGYSHDGLSFVQGGTFWFVGCNRNFSSATEATFAVSVPADFSSAPTAHGTAVTLPEPGGAPDVPAIIGSDGTTVVGWSWGTRVHTSTSFPTWVDRGIAQPDASVGWSMGYSYFPSFVLGGSKLLPTAAGWLLAGSNLYGGLWVYRSTDPNAAANWIHCAPVTQALGTFSEGSNFFDAATAGARCYLAAALTGQAFLAVSADSGVSWSKQMTTRPYAHLMALGSAMVAISADGKWAAINDGSGNSWAEYPTNGLGSVPGPPISRPRGGFFIDTSYSGGDVIVHTADGINWITVS